MSPPSLSPASRALLARSLAKAVATSCAGSTLTRMSEEKPRRRCVREKQRTRSDSFGGVWCVVCVVCCVVCGVCCVLCVVWCVVCGVWCVLCIEVGR